MEVNAIKYKGTEDRQTQEARNLKEESESREGTVYH